MDTAACCNWYQLLVRLSPVKEMPITLVYGDFDATKEFNFFLVQMPEGRIPWAKKIAPAINKLVQSFVPTPQPRPYKRPRHFIETRIVNGQEIKSHVTESWPREKKRKAYWNVDGVEQTLWDNGSKYLRYDWNGTVLVKVEND